MLSEARLKEQGFIERVSFRAVGECVLCTCVGLCVCVCFAGDKRTTDPHAARSHGSVPSAKEATALLLHHFNYAAHLFTFAPT